MRRHRRLVLIDRIIPFLAAFVGLIALAGAVLVQLNVQAHNARLGQELASLRMSLDDVAQRMEVLAEAGDDGTAEGLLALQDRMNAMEAAWQERAVPEAASGDVAALPGTDNPSRIIDPSWPTDDCIPTGTRFIALPGESYPICQSPAVVRLSAITAENVVIEGGGVISTSGIGALPGTSCSAAVLSADADGFAELRVTCQ